MMQIIGSILMVLALVQPLVTIPFFTRSFYPAEPIDKLYAVLASLVVSATLFVTGIAFWFYNP